MKTVYAHCDIPCGIYDPHEAIVGAATVLRMMDLIADSKDSHDVARYTAVKERHAEKCKHEVRVIWGDYFKEEHPSVEKLVHEIMQWASKARQGVDRRDGEELLDRVNQFAEIFWDTKGVKTKKVAAPYSVEDEIVIPIL